MLYLIEHFPAPYEPRTIQKEILVEIEDRLKSGYKKIILCAPTGVGKSFVGATVAKHFGTSFTITASKHLQNQYIEDVKFLKPVKGKSNFACLKTMERKNVDDIRFAEREGLTCEMGQCLEKKIKDGKQHVEICRFKPTIKNIQDGVYDSETCLYYLQKYQGVVSPHSLWNYHSFFQIIKFNKKLFEEHLNKRVSIFDEAHKLEDQVVQFVGYELRQRQLEEAGINPERFDLDDLDDVLEMISGIEKHYAGIVQDVETSVNPKAHPSFGVLNRLTAICDAAAQARVTIRDDRDNFVANSPVRDQQGKIKSISIKPIDISKFTAEFFYTDYVLFMSATIDKPSFCENVGLDPGDVAMVDTPKSPFSAESRRVDMLNVRHLNYRSTDEDRLTVIKKIDEIMTEYSDKRGLVLTSSISQCYEILKNLSVRNKRRVRICHSINSEGKTQNEVIDEHRADPTGVLLSSSLWEGVDLKDDLSRFQIIAKIPYPNYAEKRTRIKMKKFTKWYTAQTLTKFLQGLGRSVRNENDWARTYVLDAAVGRLLTARDMIPRSYHDVLKLG